MRSMFYQYFSLTNLNLSNFNINNVNDMKYMFNEYFPLTNLSNFITNKVTDMGYIFLMI